ncbi:MAG: hypothetical protein RL220_82 [Bacteroidota bacterium]
MGDWTELRSVEQWNALKDAKHHVVLFKHSYRCSISSTAWNRMKNFAKDHPAISCFIVDVVGDRSVSMQIADDTGITHESPQVIAIEGGSPIFHASHLAIIPQEVVAQFASVE